MPVKPDREYRSRDLTEFRTAAENDNFVVEGYASTFEPYVLFEDGNNKIYERVNKEAFEGCDFSDCVFNYNHSGRVFARTRNKTLDVNVDANGLHIRADLGSTTASREMFEDIKSGLIDQMSFAFVVDDEEYDQRSHTRIIKHIAKVYDVSAVSLPANPETSISARDKINGLIEIEKRAERLEAERKKKMLAIMLEVKK